jgi:hypothetical protein
MEHNQKIEKKRFSQADGNKKWTENIEQKTTSGTLSKYYLVMTDSAWRWLYERNIKKNESTGSI